jgi:hypothetical protein
MPAPFNVPPPAPHTFVVTVKVDRGVIVQVPAVDRFKLPSAAKSQVVFPLTAGEIVNTNPPGQL